jgi:hypothetical protein
MTMVSLRPIRPGEVAAVRRLVQPNGSFAPAAWRRLFWDGFTARRRRHDDLFTVVQHFDTARPPGRRARSVSRAVGRRSP